MSNRAVLQIFWAEYLTLILVPSDIEPARNFFVAVTSWNNVVTACSSCNVKKGGKLYKHCELKLFNKPYAPTIEDLHKNGRNFPPNFLHESWMDYLYWDIELEP